MNARAASKVDRLATLSLATLRRYTLASAGCGPLVGQRFCLTAVLMIGVVAANITASASAAVGGGLRYHLRHYSVENGLPDSRVQALLQDREGYLWVGTSGGAARFDGRRFVSFTVEDGLAGGRVYAMAEDAAGVLWFGTDRGLSRYARGQFRTVAMSGYIRAILPTRGGVWLGTVRGPARYVDGQLLSDLAAPEDLRNSRVVRLLEEPDGSVWFATMGAGLFRYDGAHYQQLGLRNGLPGLDIRFLGRDRHGNLLVGTDSGAAIYRHGRFIRMGDDQWLSSQVVLAMLDHPDFGLLLGTAEGIKRLNGPRPEPWDATPETASQLITSLLRDREGNLWIGTYGYGLYQFRNDAVMYMDVSSGVPESIILSITEGTDGDNWFGLPKGAIRLDRQGVLRPLTPVEEEALRGRSVRAALRGRDGVLWLGVNDETSDDDELLRYDGKSIRAVEGHGLPPGLSVLAMTEDSKGHLWLGTLDDGIFRFDGESFHAVRTVDIDSTVYITAMFCDSKDRIWAGTGRGLRVLDNGVFRPPDDASGLLSVEVMDITEDSHGNIWIGTLGAGVIRYTPSTVGRSRVSRLTADDGLSSNLVYLLLFDGSDLWVGTNRGLDRLVGAELDGPDRPAIRAYDAADGYVGASNRGAAHRSRNGVLWFGTMNGAVRYDPGRERPNRLEPRTRIERVQLFRAQTDWSRRGFATRNGLPTALRLSHRENHLTFDFVGVSLTAPEKIRYVYKMEGVDRDWSPPVSDGSATYSALPPGEFTFKVKSCNGDGVCNRYPVAYGFSIRPPWWRSGWFITALSISILGCIYGVLWTFEQRVRHRTQELREEIAERQRAEARLATAHQQLVAASRQAGMAEVASNVLHNVGNVLNSVNVSADVVAECLRTSRIGGLERALHLLREHENDLGAFLVTDPRGGRLLPYLSDLSERLRSEQSQNLEELDGLRRNVEHIKEIVAMQQSYARVAGVTEILDVVELVEDSVRLNAGAYERHGVDTIREFDDVPRISVDKHRVLQILVNLLRNAKYACDESGRDDRRVTVRVTNGGKHVRIAVIDNGVGIPPANLTRIFQHGFTTRESGHGFGLHSSALAAGELGGSLIAQSEGIGQGATFILELPLTSQGVNS